MTNDKFLNIKTELIATGFSFTEGMASDKDGNFYFVDIGENRVHYYDIETKKVSTTLEETGGADGLFVDSKNNLWICELNSGVISKIDENGKYLRIYDNYNGEKLSGPNDLWFDSHGGFYFTDSYQGHGDRGANTAFYYVNSKGVMKLMDNGFYKSNGIHANPEETILYVADYLDDTIYSYEIIGEGILGERKFFAKVRCDGMTVDENGNIYLCTGNYSDLVILNKNGEKIGSIDVPENSHNICFAGKNYNELYIAASSSIYKAKIDIKGSPNGSPNKLSNI